MKTPAYNPEAERAILGIVLNDKKYCDDIFLNLEAEDFYSEQNNLLFRLCKYLWKTGNPIDFATLIAEADKQGITARIGGIGYLSDVSREYISGAVCESYIEILKTQTSSRKCCLVAERLLEQMNDPDKAIPEALEALSEIGNSGRTLDMRGEYEKVKEHLRLLHEKGEDLNGIRTPFKRLDRILGGFPKGEVCVIAARPGIGKSALINQILINTSLYDGKRVALFSLEMSVESIVKRIIANLTGTNQYNLRRGKFDLEMADMVVQKLIDANVVINNRAFTLEKICKECRILKRRGNLDLVCVDYLQIVGVKASGKDRRVEVDRISRTLKLLAMELDIPIVSLSQINRGSEKDDREPQLSDLRESGAIEQDASQVIFLYRKPGKEKTLNYDDNTRFVETIIAKNRNGAVGKVFLKFKSDVMQFEEVEEDGSPLKVYQKQTRVTDLEPYTGNDLPFD